MMLDNRDATWMPAMARLKPGISRERAEAAADTLCHRIIAEFYGEHASAGPLRLILLPGSQGLSKLQQQFSKPLLALMVLVALVLLIACANVANLLLARTITRQKEISLRLAIGASRGRLIRQLLTESTVVSVAGGVLGLLVAFGCTRLLVQVLPATRSLAPEIDWRVLAFCFATSIIAGILFGLAPAWQSTRADLAVAIKGEAARSTHSPRLGVRSVLLIGQVALAVVLLVGASLFAGTLRNLQSADSGFRSENVLQLSLNPQQTGSSAAQVRSFYGRLLERVRALPGVHAASLIDAGLMSDHNQTKISIRPAISPARTRMCSRSSMPSPLGSLRLWALTDSEGAILMRETMQQRQALQSSTNPTRAISSELTIRLGAVLAWAASPTWRSSESSERRNTGPCATNRRELFICRSHRRDSGRQLYTFRPGWLR